MPHRNILADESRPIPGPPVDRPNLNTRDAMRHNVRFLTKNDFRERREEKDRAE
jgi:hypothetical protein